MIRTYQSTDQIALLHLLQLNIPTYFHPSEQKDFEVYLTELREDYFVVEQEGCIIGSGGINYFREEHIARISWDVLHPDWQGKGIGSQLLKHRLSHIQQQSDIQEVIVRTSQLAYLFYEKFGFQLIKKTPNFWAKDFDLYEMKKSNKK